MVSRAALALVAALASSGTPTGRGPISPLPGRVVEVYLGDFYFQAPDTIPAGLTTIRLHNRGGGHAAWVLRLDPGHSAAELLKSADGPTPWAHELGGPGFAPDSGSANATLELAPGNYALVCFVHGRDGVSHLAKGMLHPFVVRRVRAGDARISARTPPPDVTLSLANYGYHFSRPLHAGRQLMRVVNADSMRHEFKLFRVLPGHTAQESLDYDPRSGAPPPDEEFAGLATMPAGQSMLTTLDLPGGEYTLFCIFHAKSHGMKQAVRVR